MHTNITISWTCVWATAPSPGRHEDCLTPNLSQDILRIPEDCHHFPLASPLFTRFLVSLFGYCIQLSSSYFIFSGSLDVPNLLLRLRLLPPLDSLHLWHIPLSILTISLSSSVTMQVMDFVALILVLQCMASLRHADPHSIFWCAGLWNVP